MQQQLITVDQSVLDANVLSSAVVNVVRHGKTSVEFDHILNYTSVTHYKLNRNEMALWDLFWDFGNVKNACAVLNYCIENKSGVTNESFRLANKITPSEEATAKCAKVNSFADYYATVDQAGKDHLLAIAKEWLDRDLNGETSFDAFFVNGADGETFKQGDYILGYDSVYNDVVASKVIIASPNGFLTCADNGGFFTLAKGIKPRKASAEEVPAEIRSVLDDTTTKILKRATEHKAVTIEKVGKRAEAEKKRAEADKKKADAKAAKDKKLADAKAAQDAKYNELKGLKLDNKEKIDAAVKALNKAKLAPEQANEIRSLIKAANDKLPKSEKTAAPAPAATAAKSGPGKVPKEMVAEYGQLLQGTKAIKTEADVKNSAKAIKASKLPEDTKKFLLDRVEAAKAEIKPNVTAPAPKKAEQPRKVTIQQGATAPKLLTKAPEVKAKGKNATRQQQKAKK